MKHIKFLILSAFFISSTYATSCYKQLRSPDELEDIISFTIEDLNHVTDTSIEILDVEVIRYNPCNNFNQFIFDVIDKNADRFNFKKTTSLGKIRDYSGSFHKDYAFENFAKPSIHFEKTFLNYIMKISGGHHLHWKYVYFYNTDGSTNDETGAVLYNKKRNEAFRINILRLP